MTSTLDAVYTIWLREMKRFLKSKSRMVGSGGQPLIWLAIVGVGLGSAFALRVSGGIPYLAFVAPGLVGMTILFSSIFAGITRKFMSTWKLSMLFINAAITSPIATNVAEVNTMNNIVAIIPQAVK